MSKRRSRPRQAGIDPVTCLPDRLAANRYLSRQIHVRRGTNEPPFAFLLVDVDRFRGWNACLGDRRGNRVLRAAGGRLRSVVSGAGLVARWEGDCFAIVLARADAAAAAGIAQRCLERVEEEIDHAVNLTASVGMAVFPGTGRIARELVLQATESLYEAKDAGGSQVGPIRSSPQPRRDRVSAPRILSLVRGAVGTSRIVDVYQPSIDLVTGRPDTFELLIRLRDPAGGLIRPGAFLPLIERTRMMGPLFRDLVSRALLTWVSLPERDREGTRVAVNVAIRNLRDPDFVPAIENALLTSGAPPTALALEVTENGVAGVDTEVLNRLRSLQRRAIRIDLDDFGTKEQIPLNAVLFQPDTIKLDRQYIAGVDGPRRDALVHALVQLARDHGAKVVAEGVETTEQLRAAARLGCDLAQGYLLARELTRDELAKWLALARKRPRLPRIAPLPSRSVVRRESPGPAELVAGLIRRTHEREGDVKESVAM